MNWFASDLRMVRTLVLKDWQVYQKQLAGYVAGMMLALGLIGSGSPLVAAAGALLLLVLLLVVGSYAISASIIAERKQQTGPFVMSLPVTPMDVFWGKLVANLVIYLVPFLLVGGGLVMLVQTTPLPDGTLPWLTAIFVFMLLVFCISLCVAIVVDSEGWNVFAMLTLMTLVGPYIYWISQFDSVIRYRATDGIVWGRPLLALLGVEFALMLLAILVAGWLHTRKRSFL